MAARLLHISIILIGLPAWLLGVVLPLGWLGCSAAAYVLARSPAEGGLSLHFVWQIRLHAASLLLIFSASVIALLLAVLAAYAFARLGRAAIAWVAAAVLVVPPMVYGYLWYLTVGHNLQLPGLPSPLNLGVANLPFVALAAWSIGLSLWPIPAMVLAAGWHWTGKPAWLLARLDASDGSAFARAALPAMSPYVAASLAICLLLAAQEYAVPALFSVQVWQTQWLALAQAGVPLGKLAIAALPGAGVLLVCLAIFARFWRTVESQGHADLGIALTAGRSHLYAGMVLAGLLILTAGLPTIGAVLTMPKGLHFVPGRFGPELADTPILMALVATVATAAALGAQLRGGRWLVLIAGIAWTLPMGLLAEAAREAQIAAMGSLPEALRQAPLDWGRIYNWVDLLVWVSVVAGRVLPVAWLLLALVRRSLPAGLTEQASLDGASRSQILLWLMLPILGPAVVASWFICALLAATETAAATMLRPPGFDALSVGLLNQMHYGRDGDVVAICILLMLVAGMGAGIAAAGLRRFANGRDIG
jgi:ABC-type Fe3+ transport system permease subunit